MKKEKFKRVRVLCREDSLRDVLAVLLSGNFKSEVPAAKNEAALDFRRVEGDDPYEKPIKRLSSVAKYAGWKYTLPEKTQDLPQDFDSKTEEIYNKYKKFKRDKQLLLEQREECEEGKKRIRLFSGLPVDIQALTECEFVKARFGHMPKDCLKRLLEIHKDDPYIEFFKSYESETDCWGIYLVPRSDFERVDSVFASMLFEPINIPSASGEAEKVEEQIDKNIEILNRQILEAEALEEYYFKLHFELCNSLYHTLVNESEKFEILKSGLLNNNSYILCGLLPFSTKDETEQRLKEIDGAFYTESETVKIKVS